MVYNRFSNSKAIRFTGFLCCLFAFIACFFTILNFKQASFYTVEEHAVGARRYGLVWLGILAFFTIASPVVLRFGKDIVARLKTRRVVNRFLAGHVIQVNFDSHCATEKIVHFTYGQDAFDITLRNAEDDGTFEQNERLSCFLELRLDKHNHVLSAKPV